MGGEISMRLPTELVTAEQARAAANDRLARNAVQTRELLINQINRLVGEAVERGEHSVGLPASMLSQDGFVTQLQQAGFQVTSDANDKTKVAIYW